MATSATHDPHPGSKTCAQCHAPLKQGDSVMSWFSEVRICRSCGDKENLLRARLKEEAKWVGEPGPGGARKSVLALELDSNEIAVLVKSINTRGKLLARKQKLAQANSPKHTRAALKLEAAILNRLYNSLLNTLFRKLIID